MKQASLRPSLTERALMPRNAGHSTDLERSYWFDAQIRRHRYPNARGLAEHCDLSQKAAQACIDRMRDVLHFPLEYVPEERGYRYWHGSFQLPPLWLQEPRAASLLAAYDLLTSMVADSEDPEDEAAARRLFQLAGIPATLRDRLTFETVEHHPPPTEILLTVLNALAHDRVLELDYEGKEHGRSDRRLVEPRVLHNYAGNWYLFAHCRWRQEMRMFALDRMRRADMRLETFEYPRDFDPQAFAQRAFGLFKTGAIQQARLRFSPFIAAWVVDQTWHRDQVVTRLADGSLEMRLPYAGDGLDLVREVMKFGPEVEVLDPPGLREAVLNRLRETLTRYGPPTGGDLPPITG